MNQIEVTFSDPCVIGYVYTHDATGASADADALPTCTLRDRFGYDGYSTNVPVTVTKIGVGEYQVTVDCYGALTSAGPNSWNANPFFPLVTSVIGGVTRKVGLEPFIFVPPRAYGVVDADAGNTATTFKYSGNLLADAANALIVFVFDGSPAIGGVWQVASVSGGFITLTAALPSTPAAGDQFFLIYY